MIGHTKNAFTLIELLVVISIIVISSSSWIFYFSEFIWKQELKRELFTFENNIKSLDNDIKHYKIFDYELQLDSTSLSQAYIYYTNKFDVPNFQFINFDSISGTWIIQISWSPNSLWNSRIYKHNKLLLNQIHTWDKTYTWNFSKKSTYIISGYLSWETLNNIYINYYNNTDDKSNIQLIWINSKKDQTWIEYNSVKITNIGWKKQIFWDITLLNEIYLFFENKWVETFIKINK